MTEYIVDYIVCCLNNGDPSEIPLHKMFKYNDRNYGIYYTSFNDIRCLFYEDQYKDLKIINDAENGGNVFYDLLKHVEGNCPWARRTSNMKAGGKGPPYTLFNVKLIAIDIRYNGCDYFWMILAGVLDIVITQPNHIGHMIGPVMQTLTDESQPDYILNYVDSKFGHYNVNQVDLLKLV